MNTVVDFILGSSNKKNGKTNSVSKNIPEIASAKKTLSELINKIIKLIAEKNELQEELNKMKKNKEKQEAQESNKKAQEKNSKSLLDQIVKFDGYLSNIHESLSKEDTEKLLTGIQAKIRNNKSLNTHIANTIRLNRNNSQSNATANANKREEVVEEEVKEVFQQNNSRRNIKKSPESLEELLGVSKNNRANNSGPKKNNSNSRVNNEGPKKNNSNSRVNNAGPRMNNNGSRVNNAGPRMNNNGSRVNNAGPRMNNNGLRIEPRVNNNVLNRNKALSQGLSSIAGIFLKNNEMDPKTYNKLSNLSASIQTLE
jgi:hypothetical protein